MLHLVGEHSCPSLVEDAHAEDAYLIVALYGLSGDDLEVELTAVHVPVE